MLWAEVMWTPMSHLQVRSQCWVGTGCKLCTRLAFLIWHKGEVGRRVVRYLSQQPGKKVFWTLWMDASRAEQHFFKTEKEMSSVCCILRAHISPRHSMRMMSRLASSAGDRTRGWGQGDGQWGCRVWKRSGKEVVVRRDFRFCSSQTACKLTAGHPGVRQAWASCWYTLGQVCNGER